MPFNRFALDTQHVIPVSTTATFAVWSTSVVCSRLVKLSSLRDVWFDTVISVLKINSLISVLMWCNYRTLPLGGAAVLTGVSPQTLSLARVDLARIFHSCSGHMTDVTVTWQPRFRSIFISCCLSFSEDVNFSDDHSKKSLDYCLIKTF